jgi:hypothetical protein
MASIDSGLVRTLGSTESSRKIRHALKLCPDRKDVRAVFEVTSLRPQVSVKTLSCPTAMLQVRVVSGGSQPGRRSHWERTCLPLGLFLSF